MSNVFNVEPWEQITRFHIPQFVVKRKPLLWHGDVLAVGATFPGDVHKARKLYEQHLLGVATEEKKPKTKEGKKKK